MKTLFIFGAMFAISTTALAQQSTTKTMSFEDCLLLIRNTSTQLGVAPVNIVETSDTRMVRFPTADGSVWVTCSRADRKMVLTLSTR